jgi:hypothetical protein
VEAAHPGAVEEQHLHGRLALAEADEQRAATRVVTDAIESRAADLGLSDEAMKYSAAFKAKAACVRRAPQGPREIHRPSERGKAHGAGRRTRRGHRGPASTQTSRLFTQLPESGTAYSFDAWGCYD